jgi:hypothetical protein
MKLKTTPSGAPAYDVADLGDPFGRVGEAVHDRPSFDSVQADVAKMDSQYADELYVDGVHLTGDARSAAQWELENTFRNTVVQGAYDDPAQMFSNGAVMPMTMQQAMLYSPGSMREAIAEQKAWHDELLAEYAASFGHAAANDPNLSAAIEATMADMQRQGTNPVRYAKEHTAEFLFHVNVAQTTAKQREQPADAGRTVGLTIGAPVARNSREEPKSDMIDELQSMQRRGGFF